MRKIAYVVAVSGVLLMACGGDDEDDTPPPPQSASAPNANQAANQAGPNGQNQNPQGAAQPTPAVAQPQAPPGQVMVTVVANSTPPGAAVTGGGRELGTTPLQTQVPIPAPQPGENQTFAFTFQLEGYRPATINSSPVNNTINITAALAPAVEPEEVGPGADDEEDEDSGGGGGDELTIRGRGGGPIFDNHTTTGQAVVTDDCVIDGLAVRLVGTHTYNGDLLITLRDPGGRNYTLHRRRMRPNPFRTHRVSRARGRQARGRWRLSIADQLRQDSGVLRSWVMRIRCR